MLGKIIYNEQEQSGDYKWLGIASYMTANFKRSEERRVGKECRL